ncbi:hypothetical protein CU669_15185 [Paramagnetospirillum kuznetsovii]|uniref:IrrE N-terminal-like domain-containing protein n=2 Tax=Paramagnetospirillum kuznetsovii TaxID=2053833 RepID=A0A364NVP7_9PROT|nr:hypothetical protein CU669_15185 [Paramagnetospirillum kuznetsovii]
MGMPVKLDEICRRLGMRIVYEDRDTGFAGSIRNVLGDFIVTINALHPTVRQRFTLAHEIAHFIHHRDRIGDGIVDDELMRDGLQNPLERQANKTAADILMPDDDVTAAFESGLTSLEDLARHFKVSKHAMAIRLGMPY